MISSGVTSSDLRLIKVVLAWLIMQLTPSFLRPRSSGEAAASTEEGEQARSATRAKEMAGGVHHGDNEVGGN
jgi:hypothetical protein